MKKSRKKQWTREFFTFSKRKFALTVEFLVVFIILHNVVSAVLKVKEGIFFILFFITLAYFILASAYSMYTDVIKNG